MRWKPPKGAERGETAVGMTPHPTPGASGGPQSVCGQYSAEHEGGGIDGVRDRVREEEQLLGTAYSLL